MSEVADPDEGAPLGGGDVDGAGDLPALSVDEAEALVEFLGLVQMVSSVEEVARMLRIKVDVPLLDGAFHTLLAMTAPRRRARMLARDEAMLARMNPEERAEWNSLAGEDG
jgi:hypothetical protein